MVGEELVLECADCRSVKGNYWNKISVQVSALRQKGRRLQILFVQVLNASLHIVRFAI